MGRTQTDLIINLFITHNTQLFFQGMLRKVFAFLPSLVISLEDRNQVERKKSKSL